MTNDDALFGYRQQVFALAGRSATAWRCCAPERGSPNKGCSPSPHR